MKEEEESHGPEGHPPRGGGHKEWGGRWIRKPQEAWWLYPRGLRREKEEVRQEGSRSKARRDLCTGCARSQVLFLRN